MSAPAVFQNSAQDIAKAKDELETLEDDLLKTFERWAFLEDSRIKE